MFIGYFLVTFCMISSILMIFDICDSISFKGFSIENLALKVIGPKTSLMVELLMVFAQIGMFVATILFAGNLKSRICGISSLQTRNNDMLYQTSVHRNNIDSLSWFGVYWIHKSVRDCFFYLQHIHVCNKCFNEYLPLFLMRSYLCQMVQWNKPSQKLKWWISITWCLLLALQLIQLRESGWCCRWEEILFAIIVRVGFANITWDLLGSSCACIYYLESWIILNLETKLRQ